MMMGDGSLKRLPWRELKWLLWLSLKSLWWWVMDLWKGYSAVSLKSLRWWWQITKKATLTWTTKATLLCHWKGYDDGWPFTEKATMMGDHSLKRLWWWIISTFQWFRLCNGSVCYQIINSSQWLNMHLHSGLLQLTVAMSLYKGMPSWNASSYFTHTPSLHSRTALFNMPR
jgi:hypothetical protein